MPDPTPAQEQALAELAREHGAIKIRFAYADGGLELQRPDGFGAALSPAGQPGDWTSQFEPYDAGAER